MVVKRVGVLSMAKLMGVLYGGIGLLIGALFALFSMVGGGAMLAGGGEEGALGGGMMMGMGVAMVVVAPVFYGLTGFLAGALTGWLYNVAARFVGGIEIDVQ
jgi:hypothetical protein